MLGVIGCNVVKNGVDAEKGVYWQAHDVYWPMSVPPRLTEHLFTTSVFQFRYPQDITNRWRWLINDKIASPWGLKESNHSISPSNSNLLFTDMCCWVLFCFVFFSFQVCLFVCFFQHNLSYFTQCFSALLRIFSPHVWRAKQVKYPIN